MLAQRRRQCPNPEPTLVLYIIVAPSRHAILNQCVLTLAQCRRRWYNDKTALVEYMVFISYPIFVPLAVIDVTITSLGDGLC